MKSRTPSRTMFLLLGAAVSVGACARVSEKLSVKSEEQPQLFTLHSSLFSRDSSLEIVYLAFDLVSAEFIVEDVRHSRKVWNHVDELRVDPDVLARLARNGLRIGVASADAWPILQAIFDAAGADVLRRQIVAQGFQPMTMTMGAVESGESIFSYARDGRLVGKTFKGGDKLVIVDYSYRPALGGATDLRINFEVRRTLDELTWLKRGGEIEQGAGVDRHVFDQLEVRVTVAPHEFLVFGITDLVGTEYLVGSRFLSSTRAGVRRETLYCITPVPIRVSNGNVKTSKRRNG